MVTVESSESGSSSGITQYADTEVYRIRGDGYDRNGYEFLGRGTTCRTIGNLFNGIGILKENGKNYLYLENNGSVEKVKPVSGKKIYFRVTMNARTNQHQLYYSTDNKNFTPCGEPYSLRFGDWKGARVGLYSYNTLRDGGNAFFNWFTYDFN